MRNIPTYTQHPNGCGLSTLLMLLDLPQNEELEQFLKNVWNKVKLLFLKVTYEKKELQYAIALQYLLLKSVGYSQEEGKEEIYDFFKGRLNYTFEDIRIMNSFNQEQFHKAMLDQGKLKEGYLYLHYTQEQDYITPIMLMENIHTMKTDLELKILAEIFNYEFMYQTSEDMTGAIYFTRKELSKKIGQNTKVKWNKLEHFANDPNAIIIYGQYYHWLAIRGIYRSYQLKDKTVGNPNTNSDPSSEDTAAAEKKKSTLEVIQDIFQDDFFDTKDWNYKKMMIDLNDPALNERVVLNFNSLSESDRFYIFKKRKGANSDIFATFLKHLGHDVKKEMALWKEYLGKRGKTSAKASQDLDDTTVELKIHPSLAKQPLDEEKEAKILHLEQTINYIDKKERDEQGKEAIVAKELLQPKTSKPKAEKKKKKNDPPSEAPMFWEMLDDD